MKSLNFKLILTVLVGVISSGQRAFGQEPTAGDGKLKTRIEKERTENDFGSRYMQNFLCALVDGSSGNLLYSTQELLPIECALACNLEARRSGQGQALCFFEGQEQSDFLTPKRLPGESSTDPLVKLIPFPGHAFNVVIYGIRQVNFDLKTTGGNQNQLDFRCKVLTKFLEQPELSVNRLTGSASLILIENTHNGLIEILCTASDAWSSDSIVITGTAVAD